MKSLSKNLSAHQLECSTKTLTTINITFLNRDSPMYNNLLLWYMIHMNATKCTHTNTHMHCLKLHQNRDLSVFIFIASEKVAASSSAASHITFPANFLFTNAKSNYWLTEICFVYTCTKSRRRKKKKNECKGKERWNNNKQKRTKSRSVGCRHQHCFININTKILYFCNFFVVVLFSWIFIKVTNVHCCNKTCCLFSSTLDFNEWNLRSMCFPLKRAFF